jgi:hypothetical protein
MAEDLLEPLLHIGLERVEPPLQPDEAPFDLQGQVIESLIDPGERAIDAGEPVIDPGELAIDPSELAIDPSERPVNLRELAGQEVDQLLVFARAHATSLPQSPGLINCIRLDPLTSALLMRRDQPFVNPLFFSTATAAT